jgi:O-antigen ligase
MPGRITVPLIAMVLLMATHGAVGYQQATVVVYVSVLLALGLCAWFLVRSSFQVQTIQLAVLGLIVALMLVPTIVGLGSLGSKAGVTFLVCNLVAFALFSQVIRSYGDQAPSVIARSFLVAGMLSVGLAAYLFLHPLTLGGLTFGREAYFRPVGTFSTPNRFGEVAAVGTLAALYLFLRHPSRRFRYGLAGVVLALATVASGSKGVMLGVLGAVPFLLLFTGLVRTPAFWRAALALLPIVAVATYEIWDYLVVAAKLDLIQAGSVDVASGRGPIWAAGVTLFESAPVAKQVFGHGATFFVSAIGADPHSMYLHLLVDYGLVSVLWIPFLLLYGALLVIRQPPLPTQRVLGLALIAFCLVRGVSMPTVLTSFNFAMLAFWAGLALLMMPNGSRPLAHA